MSLGPLLVITGPTASGKTALAVQLAKACNGELVGADSVQIYRGFDIGSSKPSPVELEGVPHHLIDIRDANDPLDAAEYARLADAAIADIRARGKRPIVVGGSGLWLRALLRGLVALPAVDPELRAQLDQEALERGTPSLHARLSTVDPLAAASIHPNDRVRVVRALEVYAQTGAPLGGLRKAHALGLPRYHALRVVLDLPNDELTERIAQRTRTMIERGFEQEVRSLLERYGCTARPFGAVGYREMVVRVREHVDLEETARAITQATRIYARRQRTWLKNEPGTRWLCTPEAVLAPRGLEHVAPFLEGA